MAYFGKVKPVETTGSVFRSTYTGDGSTTTYNLPVSVANEESIIATINGVTQQDNAYSTNGTQIIFSTAPALNDSIELRCISGVGLSYAPADGSVTTNKLADGTITTAKINDAAITAGKLATGAAVANIVSRSIGVSQLPAGTIIGWECYTVGGVSTSSSSFQYAVANESYTPKQTNSRILLLWDLGGWADVDNDAQGYNVGQIAYDYSTDGGSTWVTGSVGAIGGRGGNGVGGKFTHLLQNSSWSSIKVRAGVRNSDAGSRTILLRSDLGGSQRVTLLEIAV